MLCSWHIRLLYSPACMMDGCLGEAKHKTHHSGVLLYGTERRHSTDTLLRKTPITWDSLIHKEWLQRRHILRPEAGSSSYEEYIFDLVRTSKPIQHRRQGIIWSTLLEITKQCETSGSLINSFLEEYPQEMVFDVEMNNIWSQVSWGGCN